MTNFNWRFFSRQFLIDEFSRIFLSVMNKIEFGGNQSPTKLLCCNQSPTKQWLFCWWLITAKKFCWWLLQPLPQSVPTAWPCWHGHGQVNGRQHWCSLPHQVRLFQPVRSRKSLRSWSHYYKCWNGRKEANVFSVLPFNGLKIPLFLTRPPNPPIFNKHQHDA